MTALPTTTPAHPPMTHRQILIVFSGLMLGMLLAALDQTIVATALPTIVGELGGLDHLSWVVTAYLLTATASTPLYGKISDLYGRKVVFQAAILIFVVGSALSGAAHSMSQLIGARAVQGLGAGGLMTLALTIIADIVSPRERGRYQGYFGAVFAVSSVAGPLLGGFFTDHLTWRWVFYINLPLGIAALAVTSTVLNMPFTRRSHQVDYLGAAVLVAGVSSLLLALVWGGQAYAWGSPTILGLTAAGLVLLGFFVWWEHRASEPILPPALFRNSVFSVSTAVTFVLGLAMFGAIVFLPLYLQLVDGVSATASGLLLLPLMVGVLAASITSGRLVSKLGRYRIFPIIGTALLTVGMLLLSRLGADTSRVVAGAYMVVVGLGMGAVMPITTLAVQNAVAPRDIGTATSAVGFFRSMGGSFGTALFGAILANRLNYYLPHYLPAGAGAVAAGGTLTSTPAQLAKLPPVIHDGIVQAFVHSLHVVYLAAAPVAAAGLVLAFFLREVPLRERPGVAHDVAAAAAGGEPAEAAAH